jgi:hypothetical protein
MVIDDLFEIANGIDNTLLMLQEKYQSDLKRKFTIGIQLPVKELRDLDHDLYVTQNGSSDGFTPSDEIRAKILGLDFVIVSEEEKENEQL